MATAQQEAAHPTLGIWNACGGACTISPNYYRVGTIPDTFTYNFAYSANGRIEWAIMTLEQYADFRVGCPGYTYGSGWTHTAGCLAYANSAVNTNGNAGAFDFHLAEGCASYVFVMTPALNETVLVTPSMTATYNPAPNSTGACAG